jgi:hypothetical protein
MTSAPRLGASIGLALVVAITACSTQNDDAATVAAINDQLTRVGVGLHELGECMKAAAPRQSGGAPPFGVCKDHASACCLPADYSWTLLLDLPPMLAEIEANATMSPKPGSERGLFIEYASGGRWHLQWTCDVATTNEPCVFLVGASTQGTIMDLDTSALPADAERYVDEMVPNAFQVSTTTSTELHEVAFATKPGAEVTFTILDLPSLGEPPLFLIQGGKINGGFKGRLSSPLRVRPTEP